MNADADLSNPRFVTARPAPRSAGGRGAWLRAHLSATPGNAIVTVLLLVLIAWIAWHGWQWGVRDAVFAADAPRCQAARGVGACWGVIAEKGRFILLGRYPADASWRPVLATTLLLALVVASCDQRLWRPRLAVLWIAGLALFLWLMAGGAGLARVTTDLWGGLPLTVLLSVACMTMAFPLAVLLALGRRSELPAIRNACIAYIELVRGVPLVSVLFMASFMFPLLLPAGRSPDVLARVVVGITLFAAAPLAEVLRGGLQSLQRGQSEAAASLGLGWWQAQRKVVLPQAFAAALPGIVNTAIGLFKDTSLVTIVSLYELTGALSLALGSDPEWRPFKVEAYLFIAAIYFAFCFAMSLYSRRLERRLARHQGTPAA